MGIPKVLHFIWVGTKPLSQANCARIKEWMRRNPDFTVNFWVDNQGTDAAIIDAYQRPEFFREEIGSQKLVVRDITAEGVCSDIARMQIDRLDPNYGAASDLIRYSILYKFGGAYYDCDVDPPEAPLSNVTNLWDQDRLFLAELHTGDELGFCNNDVLICSPQNPAMLKILTYCEQKFRSYYYEEMEQFENPICHQTLSVDRQTYQAYTPGIFFDSTLLLTGPVALKTVLKKGDFGLIPEGALREPLGDETQGSWLRVKPHAFKDPDLAFGAAIRQIQFEVKHFGILRLEDHVNNLRRGLAELDGFDVNTVCHQLIAHVAKLNIQPHQVRAVQSTFTYPLITDFYKKTGLMQRNLLFPHADQLQHLFDIKNAISVVEQVDLNYMLRLQSEKDFIIYPEQNIYRYHALTHLIRYYFEEVERLSVGHLSKEQIQAIKECLELIKQTFPSETGLGIPAEIRLIGDAITFLDQRAQFKAARCCSCLFSPKKPAFPTSIRQHMAGLASAPAASSAAAMAAPRQ